MTLVSLALGAAYVAASRPRAGVKCRQRGKSPARSALTLTLTRSHLAEVVGLDALMVFVFFFIAEQKMEAAYYDNIIEQQRIEPEFFRMGFYGRKFPFFLRVRLATPIQSCDIPPPTASDTLRNPLMLLSHAESGRRCRSQRG